MTAAQTVMVPIPESVIAKAVTDMLAKALNSAYPREMVRLAFDPAPPRIGDLWVAQGGYYAGIVRGNAGEQDYHLVVSLKDADGDVTWAAAKDYAAAASSDHADFALPLRKEQAVMFGNVPELFEKAYYWSGEEYASDAEYAWCQSFYHGGQNDGHRGNQLRARAVRRLAF